MYIKTKKVRLKNGKIQRYYYIAMSIRIGKKVRPEIINYIGKHVPNEVKWWLKNKNEYLRQKRKGIK
ncbi:hypothetical protein COS64_01150 [archaeon CG06_land_8_20_14_3_00_37_11]|nr:MAG: hypothetical protein COS64_01150 [archaeon CG06_land_8_20_14_3_00_37_11]